MQKGDFGPLVSGVCERGIEKRVILALGGALCFGDGRGRDAVMIADTIAGL